MTALANPCQPVDILVVVHNGLEYLKECIESIRQHTKHFKIWVYDNASDKETQKWLNNQPDIFCAWSNTNNGFIEPNNYLVRCGVAPFVILLNTDTVVQSPLWARAMTSMLVETPGIGVVGYRGGLLSNECKGKGFGFGTDVDYIEGWCMCFARSTYNQHGLFDDINLRFAYGEDADFCLRLREAGLASYALHLDCVLHHGNKTVKEVAKTRSKELEKSFKDNHAYLKRRWERYLRTGSVYNRPVGP